MVTRLDDPALTHPNGGARTLGRPLPATAAILTVKSMYLVARTGGRYGLVTICIGRGPALATVFERV